MSNTPSGKLTANRVVLIFHYALIILTIAGIFVAALSNSVPTNWQNAVVAIGGIITALTSATVATNKYLGGSQNFDTNQAQIEQARIRATAISPNQQTADTHVFNFTSTEAVTDVTGVTDDFNMNPDYNPSSALDPEPESEDVAEPNQSEPDNSTPANSSVAE